LAKFCRGAKSSWRTTAKFWCAAAASPAATGTDANCNRSHEDDEGWYRTGDLGALDEQGNLFFKGRKKEVIVTPAGMNIYPEDLEAALRGQKEVRDCVVVGLERGGNAEPCAVLILRDRSPDADRPPARDVPNDVPSDIVQAIVQRANETLAEYQRMRTWFVWPEEDFPRSSTQKPRRNVIRDAVEAASADKRRERRQPALGTC
jgi:long-chain acyl-CoA synthetase